VDGAVRVELEGGISGIVPENHLSDHPNHCAAIKAAMVRGQQLKEMVVWAKNEAQRKVVLSHKPYIVQAAKKGQLNISGEDFKRGMIIPVCDDTHFHPSPAPLP